MFFYCILEGEHRDIVPKLYYIITKVTQSLLVNWLGYYHCNLPGCITVT